MVARPKRSIKKTIRRVVDSFKKPKPKRNPDVYKTGPGRKPKKLPKISDLLYRPKRDKDGNIIKPRPKNPKLPKDRKPPRMIPMNPRPPKNPRPDKTKPAPKIKNPRPDKRRPGGPGRPRRKKM